MIQDWYQTYVDKINLGIESYFSARYTDLTTDVEVRFQEAVKYAVTSGGKRLRPILSLLMYEEMSGLPGESMIPYVIGIEFIHAYSLVHDDMPLMDNDELRRGQPTVWKQYDEVTALLVGDALLSMGMEAVVKSHSYQAATEVCLAIGDLGMVRGQVRDMARGKNLLSQKEMIRLHDEKTGRLISAAILAGAFMGGLKDDEQIEELRWFGVLLGRAFQVKDDILDFEGDPDLLGKAVGKDGDQGKGIVHYLGIEKSKALLTELEYSLLEIAGKFQSPKFVDVVEYVVRRDT